MRCYGSSPPSPLLLFAVLMLPTFQSKFAPEILAKANLARSRRPTHLTRAARKRRSSQVMHGVLSRLARESEA